ncbi:MAG TPA: sigma-54 dependent transcriptional regulator, partial [Bacteroidales bacterium]|nr:sigma-54 dependent transcriptional regulator [Bacteroidales bacterium]
ETVAPTDLAVLIEGETGSGKEYIARYIHSRSPRKNHPFIALDCGAIPKDLANSELFGHIKGSFTGAIKDKTGVFEEAHEGTLFLDEIGNLSYDIQVKLLRSLQEKSITRVGDVKSKHVDVRIIAATNENLLKEVEQNTFREDLYHRLNEFKMLLPPLRERTEDILLFGDFFIKVANARLNKNIEGFDEKLIPVLKKYPWYGNLRELRNVVNRAVLLSTNSTIDFSCLPPDIIHHEKHAEGELVESFTEEGPNRLKDASNEFEKQLIINTLKDTNFNKSKAARLLKIDRKTLYNKIKQYNIEI